MGEQTRGQRFPKREIWCKDISRVDEIYDVGCMVASDVSALPGIQYMAPNDGGSARLEPVWYAIHGWAFLQ
jgi:hypothetical protein